MSLDLTMVILLGSQMSQNAQQEWQSYVCKAAAACQTPSLPSILSRRPIYGTVPYLHYHSYVRRTQPRDSVRVTSGAADSPLASHVAARDMIRWMR